MSKKKSCANSTATAHNHIMHTDITPHDDRGFRRFWIPPQWIGDGWEKCPGRLSGFSIIVGRWAAPCDVFLRLMTQPV